KARKSFSSLETKEATTTRSGAAVWLARERDPPFVFVSVGFSVETSGIVALFSAEGRLFSVMDPLFSAGGTAEFSRWSFNHSASTSGRNRKWRVLSYLSTGFR